MLRRDVTCAAAAAHARDAVEMTALSDSIWMVARASTVPRSVAAAPTVVAPASLVAPACRHHPADVSAGARRPVIDSRLLLARFQRLRGYSLRALGLAEVACSTECSASAAVAAAPDGRCNILLVAPSSRRRALVTLRDAAAACALLVPTLTLMEADGRRSRGREASRLLPVWRPEGADQQTPSIVRSAALRSAP